MQTKGWIDQGHDDLVASINLSARELSSKENWKEYNRNRQGVKIHDTKK